MEVRTLMQSDNIRWAEIVITPKNVEIEPWLASMVRNFNENLRKGEKPRKLILWEVVSRKCMHRWEKTNLVSQAGPGRLGCYDTFKCSQCGATAKRVGFSNWMLPDNPRVDPKICAVLEDEVSNGES